MADLRSVSAYLVFKQRLQVCRTHRVRTTEEEEGGRGGYLLLGSTTIFITIPSAVTTCLSLSLSVPAAVCVLPEDVGNAGLAEAVSTLGLAGLAQHQPAGLAAVFGVWSFYKMIPEASMKWQEASLAALRDACRRHGTGQDILTFFWFVFFTYLDVFRPLCVLQTSSASRDVTVASVGSCRFGRPT